MILMSYTGVSGQWVPFDPDPQVPAFTNFLGQGLSTMDFNLDGWDDLTVTNALGELHFFSGGPEGLTEVDLGISSGTGRPMSLMWLDIDNDGDRDFLCAEGMSYSLLGGLTYASRSAVWINEDGAFVDRTADWGWDVLEDKACMGMAFQDLNSDGGLEVMVSVYALGCDSIWMDHNVLLLQQGDSTHVDVSEGSGLEEELFPSFQGVWMALDDDVHMDLVVINDAGIQSECSPPNRAYLNDGDGTFTEVGAQWGLDLAMSAMSVTVGDPDGDGVEELFITNEAVPTTDSTLHQGAAMHDRMAMGAFAERSEEWGLDLERWSWGATWLDQDQDGWEDLLVATHFYNVPGDGLDVEFYDNYFLRHPGTALGDGNVFEEDSAGWPGRESPLFAFGRCDLDGDGLPDVVGVGTGQFAQLWRNGAADSWPDRHWLNVQVCGTYSNSEAIGSRLVLHAGGRTQMRTLRAGEDLYSQHSATRFFGLDTLVAADSLEVFWPNGTRSVWHDLGPDSLYRFVEGQEEVDVVLESIAGTDSAWVQLVLPPRWTGIIWNGEPVNADVFQAPIGSSLSFEVEWMGGLFNVSGEVDWSGIDEAVTGCTIPVADNYNPAAEVDDGSCTYSGFCGPGTTWSLNLEQCVPIAPICSEDVNGNGLVEVSDLLQLLNVFGAACPTSDE